MTAVNGHVEELQQPVTPSLHLGKRKRSLSSEKPALPSANGSTDSIQNLIRELKQYVHSAPPIHANTDLPPGTISLPRSCTTPPTPDPLTALP